MINIIDENTLVEHDFDRKDTKLSNAESIALVYYEYHGKHDDGTTIVDDQNLERLIL